MKLISKIPVILFTASILLSCNNDIKTGGETAIKAMPTESFEGKEVTLLTAELRKLEADLLKKTSLTDEELVRAFPKNVKGSPLDSVSTVPGMGRVYGQFSNGKLSVFVIDSGGVKNGSAISFLSFYNYVHPFGENSKIIKMEREGFKTISIYNSGHNETEIRLLFDDRFVVNVSSNGLTPEELWEAFDIQSLNEFKALNR